MTAKQRYPWNGLVDITCKVAGINGETNGLKLAVAAVMPDTGNARSARNFWVVQGGTNSTEREVHTNGSYRLLWDARADLGIVRYPNMVVRVNFGAHEKVQLWEGGPYWATTNIGAENPEDYGLYFWWGDIVGYTWTSENYYAGITWVKWVSSTGEQMGSSPFFSELCPTYEKNVSTLQNEGWIVSENGTYVLAPEHDAAQVQWGGGWRMPTYQELYDLCNNKCDWTWTSQNGVNGYIVRGRGDYASNSIFLPCAGYGNGDTLGGAGSSGEYWSSVKTSDSCTWFLDIYLGVHRSLYSMERWPGRPIRPVQGFTK